jgi:hypothetical protein
MSEVRLAPGLEVSALLLRASGEGGFGAVLAKGDPERGTILLVLIERGAGPQLMQRRLSPEGNYIWESRTFTDSGALDQHLAKIRRADPDIWILELDIPSVERFIAEMT